MKPRGALAIITALIAVAAVVLSVRAVNRTLARAELCDLVVQGLWEEAVDTAPELAGPSTAGLAAADCRCTALVELGRLDQCLDLMDGLVSDRRTGDWVPSLELTRLLMGSKRSGGDPAGIAELARRSAAAYPDDGLLQFLEFTARATVEDELAVAEEMATRLSPGGGSTSLRLLLSSVFAQRGATAEAIAVLGDAAPSGDSELRESWFHARMLRLAEAGDGPAMQDNRGRWAQADGSPHSADASYVLALSLFHRQDPERSNADMLLAALQTEERLSEELLEAVYIRLIATLIVDRRQDEALEVLARGSERFELTMFSPIDIQRTRMLDGGLGGTVARSVYRFSVRAPLPGAHLMVEAPPELPVDTDYLDLGLEGAGPVELSRPSGPTPLRWAYHDADGATVASGNSWTAPGTTADVIVQPGAPIDPLPSWRWTPRPAAGRGRVVMVIPDCMDWRIVQYLRTRGELPVMDELIARGRRAVVWSEPAYTAAAMNSLTHPAGRDRASVLEALAELGSELRERSTTATNPVAWMESILPTATDVFDHLGGADHVVTNLLYGHGVIDSARQGTVVGPYGEVNPPVRSDTYRPITDDEFAAVRGLEEAARGKEPRLFTESAALMDLTVELAIQGRSDLVMVRIGPLDILTHGDFSTLSDGRQDDGVSDLLALYRYMDLRIGQVAEQLDGNDTLIVASDHGIRTAMEHDERAVFVVVGPGIEPGRVAGHPDWRGVPALIARLLGEDVDWPRGGLELEPQAD